MATRKIYMTTQDRKRLESIGRMADQDRDRGDLFDLFQEIQQAKVVAPEDVPPDVITMNSRARLLDLDQGETVEYALVYPQDADFSKGKISVIAPIGAAMLGYRVGSVINWITPGGKKRFKVEAVLYQPEAAGDHHL
ncbi:MAG: nucleoside diphosphate kinase regulator [Thermoanaerobaculia bacterium]|nr:nucleoside diphosphate kinase regulator [Thermoanaerobaculia bacterium]